MKQVQRQTDRPESTPSFAGAVVATDPADLLPVMPSPWVFDGYRRIYDNGRPTETWSARAVNPDSLEFDDQSRPMMEYVSGQGGTMMEARRALLVLLAK